MVTHNQNNFCHNSRSARKTETETLFSLLRINKIPFPLARARYARMRVLSSFFLSSILYKRRNIYKYIFLIIYKVYKRKNGNTELQNW